MTVATLNAPMFSAPRFDAARFAEIRAQLPDMPKSPWTVADVISAGTGVALALIPTSALAWIFIAL